MSATPLYHPNIDARPLRGREVEQKTRPAKEALESRPKARAKRREQVRASRLVVRFVWVGSLTFAVSMLYGNMKVEQTRYQWQASVKRLKEAKRAEALLRDHLAHLTGLEAIGDWAVGQGFVAPGAQP